MTDVVQQYKDLDKYYTKDHIAEMCVNEMIKALPHEIKDYLFIEPSAGSGAFIDAAKAKGLKIKGFDILPTREDVIKNDFINRDLNYLLSNEEQSQKKITIGNPPFGRKSALAIDFVNKSLEQSDYVCFIIPNQFEKWSVQSKINPNAKLIANIVLPEDSFILVDKTIKLRCVFQIWTMKEGGQNLRIQTKPETNHPDFVMYQYNRTPEAEKYFDMEWDFAVPRQGYNDYTFKAYSKEECDRKKQWVFFKASSKEVLDKLLSMDFVKLSKSNLGLPGFGKADVVKEYKNM